MASNRKSLATASSTFPELKIFGERPLIAGESPEDYDAALREVARAMAPNDFVDWMYVRDVRDVDWEILRCRRVPAGIIENARPAARSNLSEPEKTLSKPYPFGRDLNAIFDEGLAKLKKSETDADRARRAALRQSCRDAREKKRLEDIAAGIDVKDIPPPEPTGLDLAISRLDAKPIANPPKPTIITEAAVTAEAFKQNIDPLVIIAGMQERLESRRNKLLQEYYLRRVRMETPMRLVLDAQNDDKIPVRRKARPDKRQTRRRSTSR